MTKYIKVTDDGLEGYHSVPDNFRLPYPMAHESYEWVDESEVREHVPAIFGPEPEPEKPKK